MSSILKALKKLEDGKAARPPGSLDIGSDILRGDAPRHTSPLVVILIAALLFICGSGATYVYLKYTAATPAIPPPLLAEQHTASAIAAPAQQPPAPHVVSARTKAQPRRQASVRPLRKAAASEANRPIQPAVRASSPGTLGTPVIKVNGIAFQGDGADSVAVVNGVPVANGSMVEGARVEDIQKDRVLFSYGGEKFEVILGKSNR